MEGNSKALVLSLDKEKFHFICLKVETKVEDKDLESMCEELNTMVKQHGVSAIILPFVEGHQIDIKSMDKDEFKILMDALLKQKESQEIPQ